MSAREMRRFVVLGFASTHAALDAEELLEANGVQVVPIPAPSTLSAICGIALRVEVAEAGETARLLHEAGIIVTGQDEIDDL